MDTQGVPRKDGLKIPASEFKAGCVLCEDAVDRHGNVVFHAGWVLSEMDVKKMLQSGVESIVAGGDGAVFAGSGVALNPQNDAVSEDMNLPGVMIVDDSHIIRKKIRIILEKAGYNVLGEAEDGDDALSLARELRPDLITMDVVMDRLDGISAARAIKAELPGTKIIMITSNIKPSVLLQSISAGAENFVHKPFEDDHFLSVVKRALDN